MVMLISWTILDGVTWSKVNKNNPLSISKVNDEPICVIGNRTTIICEVVRGGQKIEI